MAFRGKNAVVTGGSSGIGLEVAKQLLDHGASHLAIIDISENLEELCKMRAEHPAQSLIFIKMDVSNRKGIEASYEEIIKNIGHIDIVINIAGIFNDLDVQRTIEVNIGGIINSTLAAMDHMSFEKGGKGGIICNMSSVVGLDPMFLMPVYAGTKHAVLGFTRALANGYFTEKTGIKFYVVCPGATITQMFTNFTEKIIDPEMGDEAYRVLDRLHKQSSADVARCIMVSLEKSQNGSVWIIENKQLYPIKMHKYWDHIAEKLKVAIIDIAENPEAICHIRNQYENQILIFIRMDVSNRNGIENAYKEIMNNFKTLDIVVNVAGIFNDKDVKRTIDVNVGGVVNSTFVAMQHMSKENGGKGGIICNMSSVVALDPLFLLPVYSATKCAILGFTRALANGYFYEKTGIKFSIVCPGATITPLFNNTPDKVLIPDLEPESYRLLEKMPKQSSADAARGIIGALQKTDNGSVWIIEEKKLIPVQMEKYWDNVTNKLA
ncbi:fat body protein 2 [Condylostylus longicornis]|uniref:fat body protein 2 n=1 Tax=Condylostylus longicornis TaxID=2530218 RepID=UPI00244E37FA|nr:fat body protein 2 [Condylostylus longicornis]